jgi:hypothetical protein
VESDSRNTDNVLPGFYVDLTEVAGGYLVDVRIATPLKQ